MRKLILIALTAFLAGNLLSAQPEGRRPGMTMEERLNREMKMFKENLKISEAQEKKIVEINKKYLNEFESAREMERGERWQKMRELQDKRISEIEEVLTGEQKAEFKKIREERREEMNRRRGDGPPQ